MKKNLVFILVLLTYSSFPAIAQTKVKRGEPSKIAVERRIRNVEGITAQQMKDYLYFIASDEMEGRDTPSRGLDTTAKFIGMNLSRWGFKPAGDDGTYYQKILLHRDVIINVTTAIDINGQKFTYGEDLIRFTGKTPETLSAPVVFVGNGWMIKSKNLNPYEGLEVKGKLIAVYGEGPPNQFSSVPFPEGITADDIKGQRGADWADVLTYARANGAVGVILLSSKFLRERWAGLVENNSGNQTYVEKLRQSTNAVTAASVPFFVASQKLTEAIIRDEAINLSNNSPRKSFVLSKKIDINLIISPETLWTQNVAAIWEGSDAVTKNEMVALGAHYDHIGISQNVAPGADRINNGADDDGSGTTAILSMAEALAKSSVRPKRSVLFVWHCGEEKGLWGSKYFTQFPTVDLKNVIAQLNIDMIGRSRKAGDGNPKNKDLSGENAIYVIGSQMMSSQLGKIVADVNNSYLKLNYDFRYDDPKDPNRFFFRADHFNYAVNGIPITFWFDGEHEDYHGAGDSPDKIDYNKMEKVTRTIFLTMWELANAKERPLVDKKF